MSNNKSGADNRDKFNYGTNLSTESIKIIGESIGVSHLPDEVAREIADDVSFKIKQIVQDAKKFMHHSKRAKLCLSDVDESLKIRNIEPQVSFLCTKSDWIFEF